MERGRSRRRQDEPRDAQLSARRRRSASLGKGNEAAANVVVSLRAGIARNSLKLVKTKRTGSDGRFHTRRDDSAIRGLPTITGGRVASAALCQDPRVVSIPAIQLARARRILRS
jgi:hypothetical protein